MEGNGSTIAAKALARAGVRHMFGVVGIPVTSLANVAVKEGVRFLAFHNEQSAGYAAGAYGYLTATPGVLLTVSGPGCVHGLAGLSNATANAWPFLMISGSCSQSECGLGDFQELDQMEAVKPFVKFSAKATTAEQIPSVVVSALRHALAGRPGACYVDLPADVLHETLPADKIDRLLADISPIGQFSSENLADVLPRTKEEDVREAAELLRKAERPLIVLGKGAAYACAEAEAETLVRSTGIPFLTTPMAKGLISDTHPLCAAAARSLALSSCDVALIVGARLNWLLHFGRPPKWSPSVKFIIVDVDEEEIRLRKPALGLRGDAKAVLRQILGAIKDDGPFCLGKEHPWVSQIAAKVSDNVKRMEVQLCKEVVPLNFLCPMKIIRDAILALGSPAPVLVSEGANTMDVGRSVLIQTEPRTRLDAGTWGTMGVGLGYCVAAAVACPNRLVVAVEGDSGFGFSGLEVETLVRYKLPVIVIIFNNGGVYGGDRRSPEETAGPFKDDPAPTSFVPGAAYHVVMEAFGGKGYLVQTPQELREALAESFAKKEPAVINLIIDPYAGAESGRLQHKN
eukprot:TRINITY_DN999_c0_g1_i1.p1 TRINITY_DN999_c0_g1~~TRINITY_DN999_c0_g1_i1.p1  ORF type:complete len:571 (-),score=11.66 TRINITY_DN999_c0_g1_i1:363-2075(-)